MCFLLEQFHTKMAPCALTKLQEKVALDVNGTTCRYFTEILLLHVVGTSTRRNQLWIRLRGKLIFISAVTQPASYYITMAIVSLIEFLPDKQIFFYKAKLISPI